MGKIKVHKDVFDYMIGKLQASNKLEKSAANSEKMPENDKKVQNKAEKTENKQITGKLEASKNIFSRGDFDEYKISDEELKAHYGQTADGHIYDLTDPTEKFYYDLKRKFDEAELVEKSSKYIKRWFSNGEWHYKYPPKYKANQNRTETKRDIAQSTKLITGIEPLRNPTEQEIDEALVQLSLYAIDGKMKCGALGNHSVYVSDKTQEHIKETHGKPRIIPEIKHKAKYIPFVPELLKNGKIAEKSSSSKGVVYGIVGQVEYVNDKNKKVKAAVELAINYDKDTRKFVFSFSDWEIKKSLLNNRDLDNSLACPIVDTETVPITVYSLSETPILSSKNVTKSLFIHWPTELRKFCKEKGLDYDSVIQKYDSKAVRYIAEEQLGQDAENVIAYKAYKELNKSLTYSGYKLQGRTRLYGMNISIENKKGSYRSGTDKDGHKWRTYMNYDYGYIRGTEGTDSDQIDVYVGPDKNAEKVYIIHQNDPVTHKYDEDKCMLCFSSAADAKKAYMKQYDRPGFYGSMTTMTVDEFKSFVFSKKGKMIHKSFDIQITDITENNKQQKLEQFNKALNAIADNRPFIIKHIPADNSPKIESLTVRLMNFDRSKIEKAVHKVALSLDADVLASSKGESFVYESQKEITENFYKRVTNSARAIYDFVINYFDLPDIRVISKAGELRHKGKILYNPETGKPIKESEWKRFIVELEKFLNRNYTGVGEKIVLSAESLGIILDRLSKTNSLDAIRKMSLSELKAKRYDIDWISESIRNMHDKFGEAITRERQARIQIACESAAQRVTRVKDDMRNNIQQIIIDGIRDKQSKSVVAQNLFDKCASLNRDMQRIADSEVQMAANSAYCKEEVYNTKPGEKVYFKRFEMNDDNTCKACKKLNGTIAIWSDVPLPDEHVRDPFAKYAIWDGKNEGNCPVGIVHPYCRGSWIRYYPELD